MNADVVYAELLEGLLTDALRSQAEEKVFRLERERDARSALGEYKEEVKLLRDQLEQKSADAREDRKHAVSRLKEAESKLDPLAQYIIENVEGEPSQSQGVVENAIRLLKKYKENIGILQAQLEAANEDALRWRDLHTSQSKEIESLAAYGTIKDVLALLKGYREEEKERVAQVKERLKKVEELEDEEQ